jgi:hypothetical protein
MTIQLSSNEISELETFIKSNKPGHLSMSYNTIYKGKKHYAEILDKSIATYMIFSCEGFTTYALYKSVSGKVYVFSTYMQTLNDYCSSDIFLNF